MKTNTLDNDRRGLSRRQLLSLATLTSAGLAAASVGVPETKAAPSFVLSRADMLAVNTWLFRKIAASMQPAEPVERISNQSRVACGTSFVIDIGGAF
jgi:hypothetical protein